MPEEFKFCCRLCGHDKYGENRKGSMAIGGKHSWVVNYYCKGCSVVFEDLQRFSKRPDEVQDRKDKR